MKWPLTFTKLITAWEIAFGIGGLIGHLADGIADMSPASLANAGTGRLLFAISEASGMWLWTRGSSGALPSIGVQLLQAVPFGYHGFAFRFVAGPHWTLPVASPALWAPYGFQGVLYWFSQPTFPDRWMGVNLVAVATAIFLVLAWFQGEGCS